MFSLNVSVVSVKPHSLHINEFQAGVLQFPSAFFFFVLDTSQSHGIRASPLIWGPDAPQFARNTRPCLSF